MFHPLAHSLAFTLYTSIRLAAHRFLSFLFWFWSCASDEGAQKWSADTSRHGKQSGRLTVSPTCPPRSCDRVFPTPAALKQHESEGCEFRTVVCPHGGCSEQVSARLLAVHESRCGRRPVQCGHNGGCGALIAAEDATSHVAHLCPRRSVPCPFASAGCRPPGGLLAEALASHCHGPPPTSWMRALAAASAGSNPEHTSTHSASSLSPGAAAAADAPWAKHPIEGRQGDRIVTPTIRSDPEAELDISEGIHHHMVLMARTIEAQRIAIEELRKEAAAARADREQMRSAMAAMRGGIIAELAVGVAAGVKERKATDKALSASKAAWEKRAGKIESHVSSVDTQLRKVTHEVAEMKRVPR